MMDEVRECSFSRCCSSINKIVWIIVVIWNIFTCKNKCPLL